MTRSTGLALLAATTLSCSPAYIASYDIGLFEVERPADTANRYGEPTITSADTSEERTKYVFEDSLISITWVILPSYMGFELWNKTDHTIRIIWDDAAYLDPDGQSQRVMHKGVKYADRNESQPPDRHYAHHDDYHD